MKYFSCSMALASALLLNICTHACAENAADWNQFRGPAGSGVAADLCSPPVAFEGNKPAWKVPVPTGHSSPIIAGGRIFLTALENGRLLTLAIDRADGRVLWRREAPAVPLEKTHETSSPAASTPCADAERVYVYFGSFGLICYDRDGNEQWSRKFPTPKTLYGMATSPVAFGDRLFLVLDNDENLPDSKLSQSRVLCISKKNGETEWETQRPLVRSGWSTPVIWQHDGAAELVVLGSGRANGYNAATGAELWHATGFSRETIAMPAFGAGHVYISSSQIGGGADEQIDPAPFWNALLTFDANKDGRIVRSEMTGHFTFPLRPELPPGHPGFGIPLPSDEAKRSSRLDGMFTSIDKDKDGFWTLDDFAAAMSGRKGKPRLLAIRPGARGDAAEGHVAWELNRNIPEIPSPLFYQDKIHLVRNGGITAAVDAKTGSVLFSERLRGGGQYSASPVAANGHIYAVSNQGLLSVMKAGAKFEPVHQTEIGEAVFVTPAFDADTLYIRSASHLHAFRASK